MSLRTTTATAPTQRLRNMIEDASAGLVSAAELHTELLEIEANLGLPLTESKDTI